MIEVEKQDEVKFFKEVKSSDLTPEKKVELISSLPQEANDLITSYLNGYEVMPPTITEFLTDEYYAKDRGDHLFNFWWDILKDIYVGDSRFYTKELFINFQASVGSGKSTMSQIILAYNLVRACCRKDWFAFNGLEKTSSPLAIFCFNNNLPKAEEAFVRPFKYFLSGIPFLNDHKKRYGRDSLANIIRVKSASQGSHSISEVIFSAVCSEMSSRKYDDCADVLNKVYQRVTSRNVKSVGHDAVIVIDSQLFPGESVVNTWLQTSGNIKNCVNITAPHWKVRPELYKENSPESPWFYVYAGDDTRNPVVMPDKWSPDNNDDLTLDMDRLVLCPRETFNEASGDLPLFLAQKCAVIASSGGGKFFNDIENTLRAFTFKQDFDDVYKLDFFKDQDYTKIFLPKILDAVPKECKLYLHVDPAFTNDKMGVAGCIVDKVGFIESKGKKTLKGKYKVVFAFSIENKSGQENNIVALTNLILELAKYRDIGCVTMDTHQSRQMKQTLLLAGIDADILSMDRPASNYCLFKNLVMQGDVELPKNSVLLSEMLGLVRNENGKIDHETTMRYYKFFSDGNVSFTGDILGKASKDVTDAAAGSVVSAFNAGVDACALVQKEQHKSKVELYQQVANRNKMKTLRGSFGLPF